tara:strand:+ start:12920 stop:13651 length:732 start_codon:yes stop_codon:yes gene_type:complete
MCTLTYCLTESGYELFFNRDEQRSRAQALPPSIDNHLNSIYPIDPIGQGTWLAVHQSGLSLALLNFYQAEKKAAIGDFNSRGEIILFLLKHADNVLEVIKTMPLSDYQPFQLCVFLPDVSLKNNNMVSFQWDGINLKEVKTTLPITSSGVDYENVYKARKIAFKQIVEKENPSTEALVNYHQWQQENGTLSVKMSREDAHTVSFSHIIVNNRDASSKNKNEISFKYSDYLNDQQDISVMKIVH